MEEKEVLDFIQEILLIHNAVKLKHLIETSGFVQKYGDWEPVEGDKSNNRIIGNQQSAASRALVELLVNSEDALLIKECIKSGKDPTGLDVPQTMGEASELYFGIPDGDICKCFPKGRKRLSKTIITKRGVSIIDLSDNIQMLFLGSNKLGNPTIQIYDKGTGQSPKNFKNTFLHYQRDNKIKIPFVQGKYAMGIFGCYSKCGDEGGDKYIFILSCRHPDICKPSEKNRFGFTIIRKHFASENEKQDYYEYLCKKGSDKEIFSCNVESIPNALSGRIFSKDREKYRASPTKKMGHGSLIKLYNYNLNITDIRNVEKMFFIGLYKPALPIRIDDGILWRGIDKKAGGYSWYMVGGRLRFITNEWLNEEYEEGIDINFTTKEGINFTGKILIFNNYIYEKGKNKSFDIGKILYDKNICTFLIYNGQTHGTLDKRFLKGFEFPYLKNKILIMIDVQDIMKNHRRYWDEFFKGDRETLLLEKTCVKNFQESLKDALKKDVVLEVINEQYHKEKIKDSIDEDITDELNKFFKRNEELLPIIFNGNKENLLKFMGNKLKSSKGRSSKKLDKKEDIILKEKYVERSDDPRILEFDTENKTDKDEIEKTVKTNQKFFLISLRTDAGQKEVIVEEVEDEPSPRPLPRPPTRRLFRGLLKFLFYTNKEKAGEKRVLSFKLLGKSGEVKKKIIARISFVKLDKDTRDPIIENMIYHPSLKVITDDMPNWETDGWDYDIIARKEGLEIWVNLSSKFLKAYENKQLKSEHKDMIRKDYKYMSYFFTLMQYLGVDDVDEKVFNKAITDAIILCLAYWKPY